MFYFSLLNLFICIHIRCLKHINLTPVVSASLLMLSERSFLGGGKRFIGQGTESRKASTFCLTQKEQKPETEAEMLTLVNWLISTGCVFGANSLPRRGGQENHSSPLSDQYLAASGGSGEGSKGLGALCNVANKKMLRQTLIVLTGPLNNQQRALSSCIDVFLLQDTVCEGMVNS